MKFSHLIFDLDGTLTDPLPGMVDSINHALQTHGHEVRSSEELSRYVGPPLEGTFSQLIEDDNPAYVGKLIQAYRERYLATGYVQNSVYAGIRELLKTLREQQHSLGVCTSKPAATATLILEHFGLADYFEFVSGGDVGVRKGDQLRDLLTTKTIDQNALMIGDRSVDIDAASSNQLRSAGVTWGYGSKTELSNSNPHLLLNRPLELLHLLAEPGQGSF